MPRDVVIRNRRLEPDAWRIVGLGDADVEEQGGAIVVPLAAWKARRAELLRRLAPVGVWLEPDQDPADIAPDLPRLALVAVRFPKFTDGRGYSIASLLRRRHGYRGELRAFGDIGRDQLFYLSRVGFDSFVLPDHRDPSAALGAFDDFTVRYQAAADEPLPLFRRRGGGMEASHG